MLVSQGKSPSVPSLQLLLVNLTVARRRVEQERTVVTFRHGDAVKVASSCCLLSSGTPERSPRARVARPRTGCETRSPCIGLCIPPRSPESRQRPPDRGVPGNPARREHRAPVNRGNQRDRLRFQEDGYGSGGPVDTGHDHNKGCGAGSLRSSGPYFPGVGQ